MNKLSGEEILKFVSETMTTDEFGYFPDTDYPEKDSSEIKLIFDKLGEVKEIERHGGEGQGDKWWSVKYFKDHDVYIRIDGYYQSYHGVEFEDYGKVVKPVEKVVTVYE